MNRYDRLGDLLRDYRTAMGLDRGAFATSLDVELKTVERWERGNAVPDDRSLVKLAQRSLLSYEALLRLSHSLPTYYNLRSFRFSTSPFETDLINRRTLQHDLFEAPQSKHVDTLGSDRLELVLSLKRPILPAKFRSSDSVIRDAVQMLPAFSFSAVDHRGAYAGHIITFPLTRAASDAMLSGRLEEWRLAASHFCGLESDSLGGLHIYSFFASSTHFAHSLLQRFVLEILKQYPRLCSLDCTISHVAATQDGLEFSRKFGLNPHKQLTAEARVADSEIVPELRVRRIGGLTWLKDYFDVAPI